MFNFLSLLINSVTTGLSFLLLSIAMRSSKMIDILNFFILDCVFQYFY